MLRAGVSDTRSTQPRKSATTSRRFGTEAAGYRLMLGYVREQWAHRRWAVEGGKGVGRPVAHLPRVSMCLVVMSRLLLRCFVAHRPHGGSRDHAVMSGE